MQTRELAEIRPESSLRRAGRELGQLLLLALVIFAARSSLADHYVIPSGSMEHTLQIGDHVLVDKLAYGTRFPFTSWVLAKGDAPRRGEVVIFDRPEDGLRMIKRVVAVGGDLVSLENGALRVNGRGLRAPGRQNVEVLDGHEALLNLHYGGGLDVPPTRIPPGQLLVIGDSRGNSQDGRFFGLIPEDKLYGKATSVIYRSGEGLVWRPL